MFSCKARVEEKQIFVPSFSTLGNDSTGSDVPIQKQEMFYGILTPVEISTILSRLGVAYNAEVINPIENHDQYVSSAKTALNTGIYGVDFGYLKMFGIGQAILDYGSTIHEMSSKLGIPEEFLTSTIQLLQDNIVDPDSLLSFMNGAYVKMEDHLRKSGRESTAGLMIMGGWVEAMYLVTNMVYDPAKPDPEVVQKIAMQKYTLNSLLSFIKNYYDDPVVVYYSKKLKYLNNYFDTFDIYFRKGDLEVDTVKQVFRASGTEMNITVETLGNIRTYVASLRNEIVAP
ncbi:MAG TPA: hypothetical protein VHO50_14290 [Bacteroidales bacterium]|nr:hypothetical protein [Bacteroidales bacterium]